MCTCHYLCDNWGLLSMESYLVWPDTRHKSGCYWLVACESLCLAQATNTLEPLDFGIPEVLSHFLSVWASAGDFGLIPESPTDSRVFLCMTGLLFMYYINMKLQLPINNLIHSTSLLLSSTSYHLTKNINLSIQINSLCNNLISIFCTKIALHCHRLSSYQT